MVGLGGTVLKFDGTSWKSLASGTTSALNRVVSMAAGEIWIFGDRALCCATTRAFAT